MKFRYQIASGVSIVLILMGIVSSLAYRNIQIMQSSADWVSHTEKVMSSINKATKLLIDMETGQRGFLITGSDKFLEPYYDGRRQLETTIKAVMWLVSDNPVQIQRLERVLERYRRWVLVAGEAEIELRRDVMLGKSTMADVRAIIESERGKFIIDDIRDRFRVISETEQSLLIGRRLAASAAATQSQQVLVWGTLLTFLLAIGWSIYSMSLLTKQVGGEPGQIERAARRLASGRVNLSMFDDIKAPTGIAASIQAIADNHRYLSEQADNITGGDYSANFELRSPNDVLGRSLLNMQKTLRELKNETDEQVWLNREVAVFSAQMQKQSGLASLAQAALSRLASLTRAGHGLLYLRKTTVDSKEGKNGKEFVRFGSFATADNSHFPEQIMEGEGVIGQCALDGQSITLTDLPSAYLRIMSGLGESVPQHLLVLPVLFEGETIGVVELASFHKFSPIHLEYLERTISILSVLVKAAADRQRTESLLKGSQELTQKIQAQSKTLNSANELLEQRSQQLKDLNQNLIKQAEVLKVQKRKLIIAKEIVDLKAEQLERASNYKTDFLASMSHELRTPITSLLICAQTLADDKEKTLTEDQIYAAKTISEASNSLDSIISEILDLAKVEAGKVTLELEKVSISDTITKLTRQFEPVAKKQELEFPVVENGPLPEYVTTDAMRLEQILRNLLSNAFKFTQSGSVTLQVGRPGADITFLNSLLSREKTIAFSVTDTGIGITEEKQKIIFEAYMQAAPSTSKKYGGTGLGLSISSRLAELLGGEIHIESKLGSGSSFTLYLPYELDHVSVNRVTRGKNRDRAALRLSSWDT